MKMMKRTLLMAAAVLALAACSDDDGPDESLREKRARLGWEYVCRTKDGIFYIWRGDRTAHVPTPKDCTDSYGYRRLCKKLRRSYFLPLVYLLMDAGLIFLVFYAWSIPLLSLLTMPKNDVIQGVSLLLGSIIGMFSGAQERKEMRTLKRAMEDCEYVEQMRQFQKTEESENCRAEIEDNIEKIGLGIASESIRHRFFLVFQYEAKMRAKRNTVKGIIQRLNEEADTARRYLDICELEVLEPRYTDDFVLKLLYELINKGTSLRVKLPEGVFDMTTEVHGVYEE